MLGVGGLQNYFMLGRLAVPKTLEITEKIPTLWRTKNR